MKTLVFPDLHQPSLACIDAIERLIAHERPDQTVFLGDYFDQFHDTPADQECTARWLKESLTKPNRVHLIGNHDASYLWPSPATACPGWTLEKQNVVDSILGTGRLTDKFHFFLPVDGWLLTHAGLSDVWVERDVYYARCLKIAEPTEQLQRLVTWLRAEEDNARAAFEGRCSHWFAAIGELRGGASPAGGLLWADWREKRYGVKQLFGHTPSRWVRRDDRSVCLDTNVRHGVENYAIISDGDLKTNDLSLPKLPR